EPVRRCSSITKRPLSESTAREQGVGWWPSLNFVARSIFQAKQPWRERSPRLIPAAFRRILVHSRKESTRRNSAQAHRPCDVALGSGRNAPLRRGRPVRPVGASRRGQHQLG